MKRINLKSISEPLSGKEMRVITGGDQKPISGGSGTCCAVSETGSLLCWHSKAEAEFWSGSGGHWCCDSCSTASWSANCYS